MTRAALNAVSDAAEYRDALRQMTRCEVSGPEALAAEWRARRPTRDVPALLGYSRWLRDTRLLRAALDVVRATDQTRERRLGALALLGNFNDPHLIVSGERLLTLRREGFASPGYTSHGVTEPGSQPLPPDVRRITYDAVRRIAEADGDATMRDAAEFLLRAMRP